MTVKDRIEEQVEEAEAHWRHIAPLLSEITDEADYDRRVAMMDHLLDRASDLEDDPRAELASRIGDLIEAYDEQKRPMPVSGNREVLRYLMAEHGLTQSDLPEVGGQSVVSEILAGKRDLNWRQVRALADRFGVSTDAFRGG
ncbi:helix-turn-helix domain-containing protein [Thiohalorhabdus sp.]|uniref:helix-turn-helix domain-containing protein n=1 Tax=Thiohalorhabdus sp. TaxID=3094134 RepID=UPI002FC38050